MYYRYAQTSTTEFHICVKTAGGPNQPQYISGDFRVFLGVKYVFKFTLEHETLRIIFHSCL